MQGMIVYVFRQAKEYAGQAWYADGIQWAGPDPLRIRPMLDREYDFDMPIPPADGTLMNIGTVRRPISSDRDMGVCVRLAEGMGADVEIIVDVGNPPLDPRTTAEGRGIHGTAPAPRGKRPAGTQTVR